jgi:hypothetical protein
MPAPRPDHSAADVATEFNGLMAGLGILTVMLFPIAMPGLLLALLLALPLVPVALVAVVGYVALRVLVLPVRLARKVVRRRSEPSPPEVHANGVRPAAVTRPSIARYPGGG